MKPTERFSEMFNITREVIVAFSPYPELQPRSLDAFDAAQADLRELRAESVCTVLVSDDEKVETVVTDLLKTDPEQPIVIPFTYEELKGQYDDYFLVNRFRAHFYERDLFSFLSPLRKDLYFFGRSQLLQELVGRYHSGEHAGLFGLRKSGKTSIIYAVERHFKSHNVGPLVSIDCESPSIHGLRWFELLEKLVNMYRDANGSKHRIQPGRYSEKTAADNFAEDVLGIYASKKRRRLLVLFDEIERISPHTGSSSHWREGGDFVFFWQTLRSVFQREGVFTYMLVGTNPTCVELAKVGHHDNPLFESIPIKYVPCFTVNQTTEMVSKLGRYMGLMFDDVLYGRLVEDFGGHPFLIRQFCSKVHEECKGCERRIRVDRALYARVMERFGDVANGYLRMIVGVLRDWYRDEYDMLVFLATHDYDTFRQFAADQARYTNHLKGYGLITQGPHGFAFNIESLRSYLSREHRHEKMNLNLDEKHAEISARRNRIEMGLRVVLRRALVTTKGKKGAARAVLSVVSEERRKRLESVGVDNLLARDKCPLFFSELAAVIGREWDVFKNIFDVDKNKMKVMLDEINLYGRADAHGKDIDEDAFAQLRLHFKKLEGTLNEWQE